MRTDLRGIDDGLLTVEQATVCDSWRGDSPKAQAPARRRTFGVRVAMVSNQSQESWT